MVAEPMVPLPVAGKVLAPRTGMEPSLVVRMVLEPHGRESAVEVDVRA